MFVCLRKTETFFARFAGALLLTGALVFFAGSFVTVFWSQLARVVGTVVHQELQLTAGSKHFDNWQATPVPMYIDIYFHNWTNPSKVEKETPHFTQMGPYRFYEKRTKVGLNWHENKTVSFRQTRHWYFDAENSVGSLKDVVTTVNVVALTAVNMVRYKSYLDRTSMSFALTLYRQSIHTRRTVGELLFRGYSDDLITLAHNFPMLNKGAKVSDKFGWFYNRNGTDEHDGVFNVATGEDDLSRLGRILSWNGRNTTGFFSGVCSKVAGYSGEAFSPGITTHNRLSLFSPDLCRTIYLDYGGRTTVEGVPGYEFVGGSDLVDSGGVNPDNKCYCTGGNCPPLGLLNLTECRQGAPMFVSYPHFYGGDPRLLEQVSGMSPDPKKHRFSMTVEPNYGFPMELYGRFQINMMIEPHHDIGMYRYIPKTLYMPVMWFDQRAKLTPRLALEMWLLLNSPAVAYSLALASVFTGALLVFSVAVFYWLAGEGARGGCLDNTPGVGGLNSCGRKTVVAESYKFCARNR